MVQPRINQLVAAIAESEKAANGSGGEAGSSCNKTEPFRVALVGDSTMMMQSGVICAFLGERPGRRFDPAVSDGYLRANTISRLKRKRETWRGLSRYPCRKDLQL